MLSKLCRVCGIEKSIFEFHSSAKNKDGRQNRCRQCFSEYRANNREKYAELSRRWRESNREQIRKHGRKFARRNSEKRRWRKLKERYGIGLEEYQRIFEAQGGKCAICQTNLTPGFGTQIDHCHQSKKVRGILCKYCNTGLAQFRDDVTKLERAILYLKGG